MRGILGAITGLIVLASTTVFAQGWAEYRNPDQGFMVNFPTEPRQESTTYMTAGGEPALFQTSVAMLHPDGKIVNLTREARERAAAEAKTQK